MNVTETQCDLDAWVEKVHRAAIQGNCHANGDVDIDIVPILRWLFEQQMVETGETTSDGRIAVTIGGHHVDQVAGQLAAFGNRVEVTGPEEARAHLARLGAELTATYAAH